MNLFLPAENGTETLRAELRRTWPDARIEEGPSGLLAVPSLPAGPVPPLVFARQAWLGAATIQAASIRDFADRLFEALVPRLSESQPWRLEIVPCFQPPEAGWNRCRLIREALIERLRRQRRHLLKRLDEATTPFQPADSLVQLLLTDPEHGFLAISIAPEPHRQRAVLSPFPNGTLPVASDKAAPCRAFAKLVEAQLRFGRSIAPGETCVDLGASPGSWTYVALRAGAKVTAVDRSPLRPDLMRNPALSFHRGDAFAFVPDPPVDWLLCDVIAAPDRSIDLVLDWCRRRLCRHFVVTIKFKGTEDYPVLDRLKTELPPVVADFLLTRLCANKNEACVLGTLEGGNPSKK